MLRLKLIALSGAYVGAGDNSRLETRFKPRCSASRLKYRRRRRGLPGVARSSIHIGSHFSREIALIFKM